MKSRLTPYAPFGIFAFEKLESRALPGPLKTDLNQTLPDQAAPFRSRLEESDVFMNRIAASVTLSLMALCLASGAWLAMRPPHATADAGTRKTMENSIGMKFVYIEPGTFMMGSPADEPERWPGEKQHRVTISKGYYMQTTEVTQGQWRAVMEYNPSRFDRCGDDCPVEWITWHDAQKFISRLNEREMTDIYRLPTEAEWEYAARAGTTTPFSTGRCISSDQANYDGSDPLAGCPKGRYRQKTVPVASFAPNAWGLYDMHGNVFEWCQDWYGENYYSDGPQTDPKGPLTGSERVLRGGSWSSVMSSQRLASRVSRPPDRSIVGLGLRLAGH